MSEKPNNSSPIQSSPGWRPAEKRRQELDKPIELDEATRTLLREVNRVYPQKNGVSVALKVAGLHGGRGLCRPVGAVAIVISLDLGNSRPAGPRIWRGWGDEAPEEARAGQRMLGS